MIRVFVGEFGTSLVFRAFDQDGAPLNLSGMTAKLLLSGNPERNLAITDAANGVMEYVVQQNDFVVPRVMHGQVKLIDGTRTMFSELFVVNVVSTVS